ncbi:MAG: transglutaminase-like cysteine peptidase [Methylacidiphilales bacterium]|nr:transglutaminase-like cysteine peptidase [Candidatus Methylacidiphilales bacterium]
MLSVIRSWSLSVGLRRELYEMDQEKMSQTIFHKSCRMQCKSAFVSMTKSLIFTIMNLAGAAVFAFAIGTSGVASASPLSVTRLGTPFPKSLDMTPGRQVLAPVSAVRFCMDNSEQCRSGGSDTVEMTEARWAELESVNRSVNAKIAPRADGSLDVWSLDVFAGDCDDYAVQKRHDLIGRGWSPNALPLAVARLPTGELHLVVVVNTNHGGYALDNLRDRVLPWHRTGYVWIMRSAGDNLQLWYAIDRPASSRSERFRAHPASGTPHAVHRGGFGEHDLMTQGDGRSRASADLIGSSDAPSS